MALCLTVTTPEGFEATDAYHRVTITGITDSKQHVLFTLTSHKAAGLPAFDGKQLHAPYDIEGPNPHTQVYAHLKTLPEFQGAVDC